MKTLNIHVLNIPEYFLIVAVLFYWVSAGLVINPIAIVLILVLIFQLIYKNKSVGLLIPSVLILLSLYMLLALWSEFNEFPSFNADAKELLYVGLTLFIGTILLSGLMIYKYARLPTKKERPMSHT